MERAVFTRTLSRVPGPVTVVTTVDPTGRRSGFTATSFSSVSLRPPLVLVCLDKGASTYAAFTDAQRFLVNVLAHDQGGVARRFAASGVDRFAADEMERCELGLPGLPGACARVACSLYSVVGAGDHGILIGRVMRTYVSDRAPLVYYDRSFVRLALDPNPGDRPTNALHLTGW
ncbi:flavin reductase family protein [Streptomyces sp. NPDC012403]|uniref:flavin reductase family protein n=1 Tax=Streptomyces sp. NPDC012403 TaxID=3364831 RepID=UPI0036E568BC